MRVTLLRTASIVGLLFIVVGLGLLQLQRKRLPLMTVASTSLYQVPVAPIPVLTAGRELSQRPTASQAALLSAQVLNNVSATSVMIWDTKTGTPLLQRAPERMLWPASTTKLLTALVAVETYPLDRLLSVREEAFTQGTTMGLEVGEELSVKELLYGLLMQSGNDAAFVLANNHPAGYAGFVAAMNAKAKALNLEQTTFTNPSGLDEPTHKTTARDLTLLTTAAFKNDLLRTIMGTKTHTTVGPLGELRHELVHTHALLGTTPGVVGGKTGTTELAGQVLVTLVEREGHSVVVVVMGSQNRYLDTQLLIDWIWKNYRWFDLAALDTLEEL